MSDNGEPPAKKLKTSHFDNAGSSQKELREALRQLVLVQNVILHTAEQFIEALLTGQGRCLNYAHIRHHLLERRNEIIRRIPHFWFTVFMNHRGMAAMVADEEEDVLHYIQEISIENLEHPTGQGYRIQFHFSPNPYIENQVLTREYVPGSAGPCRTASHIVWKPDHNVLEVLRRRYTQRRLPSTFFTWFVDLEQPEEGRTGEVLRNEIWHNPLQYYPHDIDVVGSSSYSASDFDTNLCSTCRNLCSNCREIIQRALNTLRRLCTQSTQRRLCTQSTQNTQNTQSSGSDQEEVVFLKVVRKEDRVYELIVVDDDDDDVKDHGNKAENGKAEGQNGKDDNQNRGENEGVQNNQGEEENDLDTDQNQGDKDEDQNRGEDISGKDESQDEGGNAHSEDEVSD